MMKSHCIMHYVLGTMHCALCKNNKIIICNVNEVVYFSSEFSGLSFLRELIKKYSLLFIYSSSEYTRIFFSD